MIALSKDKEKIYVNLIANEPGVHLDLQIEAKPGKTVAGYGYDELKKMSPGLYKSRSQIVEKRNETSAREVLDRKPAKKRPRRDTRDNFPTAPKPAKPKAKAKKPKR